ncbi:SMP-30/gluconolactonase/LRE family protein [Cohnella yongneupensis]|uniref:SMP-30/gluconolactonase/LRE family protein n=1 Tax=Cohnella yongneupensis TaxID=425006 RepID=A0ABW0R619_9BACL
MATINSLRHPSWNGQPALLPEDRGIIFFDGIFTDPQLNHPECLAFDAAGNIWCGGERGEIFRIAADGSDIALMASTDGFTLGLAFDADGKLYSCDLKHGAVFRYDPSNGTLAKFADGDGRGNRIRIPNVPVVDARNGWLYVSDSYDPKQPGPGIWRFDLATGEGGLWYEEPLHFANGLALSANGDALYVAETFGRTISRIPIKPDGSPGAKEAVCQVDALPDGLTLDERGVLYISCYEPSLIYRYTDAQGLQLLYYDPEAHTLCHPTNCAVRGNDLYAANLGRWHITRIEGAAAVE